MSIFTGTDFATSSIAFRALGDGATVEDEWGNVRPVPQLIEVKAFLKLMSAADARDLLQHDQRSEPDARALSGYCVDRLPDEIQEEAEGGLTWNGKPGKFVLTQINPPYGRSGLGLSTEASLGTKIVGWWIPDR